MDPCARCPCGGSKEEERAESSGEDYDNEPANFRTAVWPLRGKGSNEVPQC